MKGYLKSSEGVFQLAPKVTTVGREGCDLVLQSPEVDFQHAVIEYSDQEECFVLQDLNTAQGTFVNDCRVQNAAVRLAPGDVIRFGGSPSFYELEVEAGSQTYRVSSQTPTISKVAYPPVHQRMAWTQPLTVITDQAPPVILPTNGMNHMLPNLKTVIQSQTATWANSPQGGSPAPQQPAAWSTNPQPVYPRPPASLRSRPLSAGARRPAYMERGGTERMCVGSERTCVDRPNNSQKHIQGVGWIMGSSPARTITANPQTVDLSVVQEKEQKILQLSDEVRRLAMYEGECGRRDETIQQLRAEVGDLQGHLRARDTGHAHAMFPTDVDVNQRLMLLEEEVQLKRTEVLSLKQQIRNLESDQNKYAGAVSRQDLNDRVMEINSLKTELERVRKDKNITTGLVTQMQRDMANKDTTISRLTRDMDSLKNEIKEKENQLTSMQGKHEEEFRRTQESKKTDEELESKTSELIVLQQRFKDTEVKGQEQLDLIIALKDELDKVKGHASVDKEAQKKLQSELDQTKTKSQDIERAERMVRVDLEQISKRLERFRNRVIQVTFSTPGIRAPDTEISDDDLLDTLKKLMEERTEMYKKVTEMKKSVDEVNTAKKDFVDNSKKLKQQINSAVDVKSKGKGGDSKRK